MGLDKEGLIMVLCTCWACGEKFEAKRISKLCCGIECRKLYQSQYDHDRYLEFRNGNRKKKREMLMIKYSIQSSNLYKLEVVCDECLTKFYHDYIIFEKFNDIHISHYNSTEYGAAICPNCGLVNQSTINDEIFQPAQQMNEVERKLFLSGLKSTKQPIIKREAIYIRNFIDFPSEAEAIRKQIIKIYNRNPLTQDEINICIATLFRKIGESK
jgi:hypothetical protein